MANFIKGEAPLKLKDGREFTLVFDMEALVEAESAYGKPLNQLMTDAQRGFVGAIRAMLFGALQTNHPEITPRDALAIFTSDTDAVQKALEAAGTNGLTKAEGVETAEDEESGKAVAKVPPGKPSGRSGAKRG